MPMSLQMVASEILMCGLKKVPIAGQAVEVIESIKNKHEAVRREDQLASIAASLTRIELRQRDLIKDEVSATLANLSRTDLDGRTLTEEIRNLRQIQEQGWSPKLFEGLLRNSSHIDELKRSPEHYGRLLDDRDVVDPTRGIHVLIDAGKTRILELPPFAFSQLLAHQPRGVPQATLSVGEDIWAFPDLSAPVVLPEIKPRPEPRPTAVNVPIALPKAGTIITSKLGFRLAYIPAGEFEMGSDNTDPSAGDAEKPKHKIELSRPFLMGQFPVTQEEYEKITGGKPSHFAGKPKHPVEKVSWLDAVQFCNILSEKEGLPPYYRFFGDAADIVDVAGSGYRLPTEAEWEYAARAGAKTRYPFGENEGPLTDYAWFDGNKPGQTQPVGRKKPNKFELHDILGNVWEWCWDVLDNKYYNKSTHIDPINEKDGSIRVLRGGSWNYGATLLRCAYRNGDAPGARNYICGFRLARTYV